MTSYKQGDVVLIEFPFTNSSGLKQRPALVVSPTSYNTREPDCVLVAISSRVPDTLNNESVLIKSDEITQSGLYKESIVIISKMFTMDSSKITKKIGILNLSLKKNVLLKICVFFSPS